LIPADAEHALQCRARDRFYDLHVHMQMQKIVGDRLRPPDKKDPYGVEHAKALMQTAFGIIDQEMRPERGRWEIPSAWPTAQPRPRSTTQIW